MHHIPNPIRPDTIPGVTFLSLEDTPDSYLGKATNVVTVNADETALIFQELAIPSVFTDLHDVPDTYLNHEGQALFVNLAGDGIEFKDIGYPISFIDLDDTPTSYTGMADKFVSVKTDETGLEFIDVSIPDSFLSLNDTPDTYAAQANKLVSVSPSENGLSFIDKDWPTTFLALSDTPDSYLNQSDKFVKVNSMGTALGFETVSIPDSFLELDDTPDSYLAQASKTVKVNALGTALSFEQPIFTELSDGPGNYSGSANLLGFDFNDTTKSLKWLTNLTPFLFSPSQSKDADNSIGPFNVWGATYEQVAGTYFRYGGVIYDNSPTGEDSYCSIVIPTALQAMKARITIAIDSWNGTFPRTQVLTAYARLLTNDTPIDQSWGTGTTLSFAAGWSGKVYLQTGWVAIAGSTTTNPGLVIFKIRRTDALTGNHLRIMSCLIELPLLSAIPLNRIP